MSQITKDDVRLLNEKFESQSYEGNKGWCPAPSCELCARIVLHPHRVFVVVRDTNRPSSTVSCVCEKCSERSGVFPVFEKHDYSSLPFAEDAFDGLSPTQCVRVLWAYYHSCVHHLGWIPGDGEAVAALTAKRMRKLSKIVEFATPLSTAMAIDMLASVALKNKEPMKITKLIYYGLQGVVDFREQEAQSYDVSEPVDGEGDDDVVGEQQDEDDLEEVEVIEIDDPIEVLGAFVSKLRDSPELAGAATKMADAITDAVSKRIDTVRAELRSEIRKYTGGNGRATFVPRARTNPNQLSLKEEVQNSDKEDQDRVNRLNDQIEQTLKRKSSGERNVSWDAQGYRKFAAVQAHLIDTPNVKVEVVRASPEPRTHVGVFPMSRFEDFGQLYDLVREAWDGQASEYIWNVYKRGHRLIGSGNIYFDANAQRALDKAASSVVTVVDRKGRTCTRIAIDVPSSLLMRVQNHCMAMKMSCLDDFVVLLLERGLPQPPPTSPEDPPRDKSE